MTTRQRALLWGGATALGVGLVIHALPGVSSLVLAAFIVAYVLVPLVDRLERRRVPRAAGAVLVLAGLVVAAAGLVLLLVPAVAQQTARVSQRLPEAIAFVEQTIIPWAERHLGLSLHGEALSARLREQLGDVAPRLAGPLGRLLATSFAGALGFFGVLAQGAMVFVVAFYLIRDFGRIVDAVAALVPRPHLAAVRTVAGRIDRALAGFVRGQLTVAAILGAIYATGLGVIGVEGGLAIGLVAGLLNIVPYLGTAIGLGLALLMAALSFSGWLPIAGVLVVFAVGQALEGTVITPRIVGEQVGLSPVLVILAVIAFGELLCLDV
jgi:predicted PurR-regulated permease PerM